MFWPCDQFGHKIGIWAGTFFVLHWAGRMAYYSTGFLCEDPGFMRNHWVFDSSGKSFQKSSCDLCNSLMPQVDG